MLFQNNDIITRPPANDIANPENASLLPNLSAIYPNDKRPIIPPNWLTIIQTEDLAMEICCCCRLLEAMNR